MKKLLFLVIAISTIPITCMGQSNDAYSGFTSTIVTDYNSSNPAMTGFSYPGDGFNSHIMFTPSGTSGGLMSHDKVDTYYPYAPTPDKQLIQLSIEANYDTICELQYNALTKTHHWLVNKKYQPNKSYQPISCKFYLYPNHMFIAVTDKN